MRFLWAEKALTSQGWQTGVRVSICDNGRIKSVDVQTQREGECVSILLASPVNLHSHAFQRAMAGMAEKRGPDPRDTFWTWRKLMYRFLNHLTPEDVEAIASFVQMEMLEAGYAAVCEFHYLHHQPDGTPYDDIAEMANRIVAAAADTGIGLTLLPVLYQYGGCDGRSLGPGQIRFGNTPDHYIQIYEAAKHALSGLEKDSKIGVAPHSIRAVCPDGLDIAVRLAPDAPFHLHIAEQTAEIDEVYTQRGMRPVEWLLSNYDVNKRWCLIHATHMEPHETEALAKSGAVVGLCPITESNLGDGIFDGVRFVTNGGRFGIGSDSNIRVSLSEELRTLEYSQRLRDRARAVLTESYPSTGRNLFEAAVKGGGQAAGRNTGLIEPGYLADLVALDGKSVELLGKEDDAILDSYIFAGDDRLVTDVWSAGRHVVKEGHHLKHEAITGRYQKTIMSLRKRMALLKTF